MKATGLTNILATAALAAGAALAAAPAAAADKPVKIGISMRTLSAPYLFGPGV